MVFCFSNSCLCSLHQYFYPIYVLEQPSQPEILHQANLLETEKLQMVRAAFSLSYFPTAAWSPFTVQAEVMAQRGERTPACVSIARLGTEQLSCSLFIPAWSASKSHPDLTPTPLFQIVPHWFDDMPYLKVVEVKHLNFLELLTWNSLSENRIMLKPRGESQWLILVCFAAWGVRLQRQLSWGQCHMVQKWESFASRGWWYVLVMASAPGSTHGCMHGESCL